MARVDRLSEGNGIIDYCGFDVVQGLPQHHFVVIGSFNGRGLSFSVKMRPGGKSWSVLDARGNECLRCDEFFCPVRGPDFNKRTFAYLLALFLSRNELYTFRRPPVRLVAA